LRERRGKGGTTRSDAVPFASSAMECATSGLSPGPHRALLLGSAMKYGLQLLVVSSIGVEGALLVGLEHGGSPVTRRSEKGGFSQLSPCFRTIYMALLRS